MSLTQHYARPSSRTRPTEEEEDEDLSLAEIMSLKASISSDTGKSKNMSKTNNHNYNSEANKQSAALMQTVSSHSPFIYQDWTLHHQQQQQQQKTELIYHQQQMQSTYYQLQYLQHQQMLAMMAMRHSSSSSSTSSSSSSSSSGRSSLSSISSLRSSISSNHQQQHRHRRPSFLSSNSYQQQQQNTPRWQPSPSSSTASSSNSRKGRHSRKSSSSSGCKNIPVSHSFASTADVTSPNNQGQFSASVQTTKRRQSLSKRIKRVFGMSDHSSTTSASTLTPSSCSSIPETKEEEVTVGGGVHSLTRAATPMLSKNQTTPTTLHLLDASTATTTGDYPDTRFEETHRKSALKPCSSSSSSPSVTVFTTAPQPFVHSNISTCSSRTTSSNSSSGKKFLSFDPIIQLHETFSATDYDRRCDTNVTCQKLTPALALKIKEELNLFKLNDMVVHNDSKQFTHFFM